MKFKIIGLTLVLGLSLSGCVASTSREDLRTCQDAQYSLGLFIQLEGGNYGNEPQDPRIFWGQRDLAKDLRDLSVREVSPELSDALLSDAERINRFKDFYPDLTQVNNFCIASFGTTYYLD